MIKSMICLPYLPCLVGPTTHCLTPWGTTLANISPTRGFILWAWLLEERSVLWKLRKSRLKSPMTTTSLPVTKALSHCSKMRIQRASCSEMSKVLWSVTQIVELKLSDIRSYLSLATRDVCFYLVEGKELIVVRFSHLSVYKLEMAMKLYY